MSLETFGVKVKGLREGVERNNLELVRTLLLCVPPGANTHPWFEELVLLAIEKRIWEVLYSLLLYAPTDARETNHHMPSQEAATSLPTVALGYATVQHSIIVVKSLLRSGADAATVYDADYWPLRDAAARLDYDLTALLLDNGASVECISVDGAELNYSVAFVCKEAAKTVEQRREQARVVRLLLERGASPHVPLPAKYGKPLLALHYACENANADIVRLLLEYNVDADIVAEINVVKAHGTYTASERYTPVDLLWDNLLPNKQYAGDCGQIIRLLHDRGVAVGIDRTDSESERRSFGRTMILGDLAGSHVDDFQEFLSECSGGLSSLFLSIVLATVKRVLNMGGVTTEDGLRILRTLFAHGANIRSFDSRSIVLDIVKRRLGPELRCFLAYGAFAEVLFTLDPEFVEQHHLETWDEFRRVRCLLKRNTSFLLALRCARRVVHVSRQFSLVDVYVLAKIIGEVWCQEHPLCRDECISIDELRRRHDWVGEEEERKSERERREEEECRWVLKWEDFVQIALICVEKKRFSSIDEFFEEIYEGKRGVKGE